MKNILLYINNLELDNKIKRELSSNYNLINTYIDEYNYLKIINQYRTSLIIVDYHNELDYLFLSRLISSNVLVLYIKNSIIETLSLENCYNFNTIGKNNLNIDYINLVIKNYETIKELNNKINSYKEKEEEERLVKKAKLYLMDKGYSENDAYKYIVKEAMKERITKKEIAIKILKD